MKRDDDVIRDLLLQCEADERQWFELESEYDCEFGVSTSLHERWDERTGRHLQLLVDAGLIATAKSRYTPDWDPEEIGRTFFRLTNAGHNYLDAIRDESIWSKTKAAVAETGGSASLEIVKSLAVGFLKSKIEKHTGIVL